jgi:hypothetical protein
MSVITEEIGPQAFEFIRNRIAEILAEEINAQYLMTYDDAIDATVYMERCAAYDKNELPAVNVSLARGGMDGWTAWHSDGTYTFHIDVYHKAESTSERDGTSIANQKMHRLIGLCRAILEDSRYSTLGFTAPFIMLRRVIDLNFKDEPTQDAVSIVMGRLRFNVKANETNGLTTPSLIQGYETILRINNSDKGYYYFGGPDAEDLEGFNYDLDVTL